MVLYFSFSFNETKKITAVAISLEAKKKFHEEKNKLKWWLQLQKKKHNAVARMNNDFNIMALYSLLINL